MKKQNRTLSFTLPTVVVTLIISMMPLFSKAQTDEVINMAIVQEWSQFNPVTINLASTRTLLDLVVRQIVEQDISGKVIPDLVIDVPTIANKKAKFITEKNQRKIVAEWTIQPEAKWGDGQPLTCGDWWMGWQVGLSPNVITEEKKRYAKIEKMEWSEKSPKKCTLTYANDDWTFDRDLPIPLPRNIEEKIFNQYKVKPGAYEQNTTYAAKPTSPSIYNGPYLISENKLGSHFVLIPNPHFSGVKPRYKKINVKHVADTATLQSYLQTQSINMISSVGFPLDTALRLQELSEKTKSDYKVILLNSPIFQGLILNLDDEILKELPVRKALSHAVNKAEIAASFFKGQVKPAETILAVEHPAHRSLPSSYNPRLAMKILEDAGWKMAENGYRKKNGKELSIDFKTSAGIRINETLQVYVCDGFKRIGVRCLIKNQPPRLLLGQSVPQGEFSMSMFGVPVPPDTSLNALFSSKEIPTKQNGWAGQNSTRLRSKKMDLLLAQFDSEFIAEKRNKIIQQIDDLAREEVIYIPIYHRSEAVVVPKSLKVFTTDVSGMNLASPELW